jgi:lysophospholipase L1-like esterase
MDQMYDLPDKFNVAEVFMKTKSRKIIHFVMQLFLAFLIALPITMSGSIAPQKAFALNNGLLNDSNLKYFGRWDMSDSTTYSSYWGGAYFKVNFTGTTVKIKLAASASFYATLDNGPDVLYSNQTGVINLTSTPLLTGTHSLRIASYSQNDSLKFQGLVLDSGAVTAPPTVSNNVIEFIGDSITAGWNTSKYALTDYAWFTGEQLSAEHTQIAYSGICLVDQVSCYSPNSIGISNQFFKLQTVDYINSPDWNFGNYEANAVVINIGTNDSNKGISDAVFQSSYVTFLQNIRNKYPNAQIFVMRTFGGYKETPTAAAVQARITAGDNKVHYINTTGWLTTSDFSDGLHPSDSGHQKAASYLVPILKPYLLATGAKYKLINVNSGKALDVSGAGTVNGTNVQIYTDNGTGAQNWQLVDVGNGNYKLINTGSGKLLDTGSGSSPGQNVQIWQDNGSVAQQWRLIDIGGGYYKLINKGLALDVAASGVANGSNVQLNTDNGSISEKWQLIRTDFSAQYEAENGILHNLGTESSNVGYTGTGYVAGWNGDGQWVDQVVNVPASGAYNLKLRYSAGAGNASRCVYVNGTCTVNNLSFPNTSYWSVYRTVTVPNVNLNAGNNTISLIYNSSLGSVNYLNFDHMELVSP